MFARGAPIREIGAAAMTLPSVALPVRRPRTGVRTILLAMFVTAVLYAGTLPVYLFYRLRAAASLLAEGTQRLVPLLEGMANRIDAVDEARRLVERAVASRTVPAPGLIGALDEILTKDPPRQQARAIPPAPSDLGREITRSDAQLSQMAAALTAIAGLAQAGRWTEATARLRSVDSLETVADQQVFLVSAIGRRDLLARQDAVDRVTRAVLRDTALWLALGVVLWWLGVVILRRRILRPLHALEAALARVAEGNLDAQVDVQILDEIGRLGAHFNEMTRVLLSQAEHQGRFAAAGQLLADTAHEVGNPLMAIAAHAETRAGDPTAPPEVRAEMQEILAQAQRAAKLLRGLLRFVRPREGEVALVNVTDVMRDALDVVTYRFGVDEITLEGRLDPAVPPVRANAVALEQVFVNLLSNAMDAMRTVPPPRRLTVDSGFSDGAVVVTVADNGPGVDGDLVPRLFRPFATTKGSHGTGLGLYVSRQLVREAGGELALAPGGWGGARFVATLPAAGVAGAGAAAELHAAAATVSPAAPSASARLAGVRVLLVDDEEAVRRPIARFLGRRGAEVLEASDGVAALALLERVDADVILADLRMPRMDGSALFVALTTARPALAARVLFLSGDVSQLGDGGTGSLPRDRILVKPVELAELERRVLEFVKTGRRGDGGV
jgi:signal transduction histidine kinase